MDGLFRRAREGNIVLRLTCGHFRHERRELETARADTRPLGLALTYLPVFSRLCRTAVARFLNN
jgi:hypothetical protein